MSDDLTPTEYLVMEVLAARYRLNEAMWTFPTTVGSALRKLENRGLVGWKHGIVEKTYLAHLTDEGLEAWKLIEPGPFRVVPAGSVCIDPAVIGDLPTQLNEVADHLYSRVRWQRYQHDADAYGMRSIRVRIAARLLASEDP